MIIKVNVKQLGKKRNKFNAVDFVLQNKPDTLKELINETVSTCVDDYNRRIDNGENVNPLTEDTIADMSEIGKISFGINYNGKYADKQQALETALLAFEDGLFKVFISDNPIEWLDEKIHLTENDTVTFIRLTMLSGTYW